MPVYITEQHATSSTPFLGCECDRCLDVEIDAPASTWPSTPEIDGERWTVSDEDGPDGDVDHLYNGRVRPLEPSEADWADYYAARAEDAARTFLDASERLTLAEVVDRQIAFYAGWGNAVGFMLAEHLIELAGQIRVTDASSPAEHFARIDALDRQYS